MNVSIGLFRGLVILIFGGFQAYLPGRARGGVFFSMTVPDDFSDSPQARRILRSYRWQVLWWTLLAEALAIASAAFDSPWTLLASAVVLAGNSLAYLLGRKAVRPFAATQPLERTASLATEREGLPGGWVNRVGPFLLLAAAGAYLWIHWDLVDDPVRALGNLARGAVMDLLLVALGLGILYGSRRATAVRRVNLIVLVAFLWTTSAASGIAAILPMYTLPEQLPPRLFPFAMLAIVAAILIWAIRETRRVRNEGVGRDATPDECWKLGQFYYNPQDPAFLVERRFGFGYTFNFANRLSWIVLAVLTLAPLIGLVAMNIH